MMGRRESIVMYTTIGCHLCEEAVQMLAIVKPGIEIEAVDVALSDELIAKYGERIPVLALGDSELSWPFGLLDLQRFLKG
ncbi:hypothetical protein Q670_11025 [Alcanivorax sp. P2S70]|jgi:glutaredoxin|nr:MULTISPECIES: glutaredoxin family protein [Alcanivorax]ERP92141.1 hypothetical protein Q670_11025 [Alcanivorax sp. P2S70]|tara:strand:- start:508 stop:747 length:240 start_codon:yes stop_codon:yes gene_type:complete